MSLVADHSAKVSEQTKQALSSRLTGVSQTGPLASLETINYADALAKLAGRANISAARRVLLEEEQKYLIAAEELIVSSEKYQMMFGKNMAGAAQLAAILSAFDSEQAMREELKPHLPTYQKVRKGMKKLQEDMQAVGLTPAVPGAAPEAGDSD